MIRPEFMGKSVRVEHNTIGPTGFWLARHLRRLKISSDLVCPSLVPKKTGERITQVIETQVQQWTRLP